jgi:hypothetical protein
MPTPVPTLMPTPAPTPVPSPVPTPSPTNIFLCSELTCQELGWGYDFTKPGTNVTTFITTPNYGSDTVCGETPGPPNYECSGFLTHTEAEEFCLAVGARLCEKEELELDEVRQKERSNVFTIASLDALHCFTRPHRFLSR